MRFDTPIHFQSIEQGEYDSSTGNYGPDEVSEEQVFAAVTDSTTKTMQMVYGELKQGCKTIRLQNIYRRPFDKIRIGETVYKVDYSRKLRTKHIFVASEVK